MRNRDEERNGVGALGKGGRPLAPLFFFTILFVTFFYGVLFQNRQLAYRDAGFFYYPLYRQVQDSFEAGRIPLWDPYENLGQPLAANPVAAVFYPIKSIFFLPLDYDLCFKAFILIHVFASFFFFYYLVRTRYPSEHPLLSRYGGIFAALAWTFGGSILFQVSNPIFLIGATWLPLLFACGLRLHKAPSWGNGIATAAVLFMMVTGGDPQTAYLGAVLLFLFFLFAGIRRKRGMIGLLGAALWAVGLGAIQIIPSVEMVRYSSRVETAGVQRHYLENFLCRDLKEGGHSWATYNFSVPPWRGAEFLWPNVGGREFPENARWFSSLPNDSRVWSPSLYIGLYPFIFATFAFLFFRWKQDGDKEMTETDRFRRFLTWMAFVSFLAALGGFGLGWLRRVLFDSNGGMVDWDFQNGDPVGGVYWLLTRILPGFASFRYPAKMMTFVSLGLTILAGFGWDRFWGLNRTRETMKPIGAVGRWGVWGLALISLIGYWAIRFGDFGSFSSRTIYGPYDADLTRKIVGFALLQTAILAGFLGVFLCHVKKKGAGIIFMAPLWKKGFLFLLCADLYFAHAWLIADAPGGGFQVKSPMTATIRLNSDIPPTRIFRDPFLYPTRFLTRTSPNRIAERVIWDRATLFQKNSALEGIANVDVRGTFVAGDYSPLSHYLRSELRRMKKTKEIGLGLERLLAALDVDFLMTSGAIIPANERILGETGQKWPVGVGLRKIDGGKRVRILHSTERFDDGWDFVRYGIPNEEHPNEKAVVTRYEPERIEMSVTLNEPGTLVIAEEFYPGWIVTAKSVLSEEEMKRPVRKIASGLRGVELPAGEFHVIMEYRPRSFVWGAILSGIAWGACGLVLIGKGVRRFRSPFRKRKFPLHAEV